MSHAFPPCEQTYCVFSTTASPATESGSSNNVNMGYGGFKWTLGESYVPEIVGGYRYASVTSSDATQGAVFL